MSDEIIERNFSVHEADEKQADAMGFIRERLKMIAIAIKDICPQSRERSLAMAKLEEAMFWTSASITRPRSEDILE